MTRRMLAGSTALFIGLVLASTMLAQDPPASWKWYEVKNDKVQIHLHFFWSQTCPRCTTAHEYMTVLNKRYDWLQITTYETSQNPANYDLYRRMAAHLNRQAGQVPAFFYCKQLDIGFDGMETSGKRLEKALVRCHDELQKQLDAKKKAPPKGPPPLPAAFDEPPTHPDPPPIELEMPKEDKTVEVPVWGEVAPDELSLPAFTLVLAGLDAFNPCAFFVLMILLSLMLHSGSRGRMLTVGAVFVMTSGIMYFLFMAAWLNLFLLLGHVGLITLVAGLVAIVAALINIKDFFWFKSGVSLSLPESAKPGLFKRMNTLIAQGRTMSLLGGTAVLAIAANLYELLCTSGFPMVYTRVLTLRELSPSTHYFYLALYNIIYVIPLALIVLAFSLTLSVHKLTEYEGRVLKLLSGLMMLALGVVLLLKPDFLHRLGGSIATLGFAILATAVIVFIEHIVRRPATPADKSAKNEPKEELMVGRSTSS